MKKTILLLLIIAFAIPTNAQLNLVWNSGFEQYSHCPDGLDQIKYANYWSSIDTSWSPGMPDSLDPPCGPEYINACANGDYICCGTPINAEFYHYPHSGNGMAQAYMYYDDTFPAAPYGHDNLQGRLRSTLIAGQSYCITFYTVMEEGAAYAINNIGAYLDDGSIDTTTVDCGQPQTQYTPQILYTAIVSDTLNWTMIQGSFIANGTEKFITISNFSDTAHTAHIRRNNGHLSLYLIDDVSVIASNATAYAGPDQTITAGCSTYIGVDSSGDGMPCYWYVLGGTAAIDSGGRILVQPADTTTYVVSMDLCGTITYDTVTVNVVPCSGPPVASFTDTGFQTVGFTYTGILGCVDSVQWSFGDGNTSNLTDPVHTYSATGTYSVCATVYTYCGSNTVCDTVVVSTTASPRPSPGERVSVYPNPASTELSIVNAQGCEVSIFNMVGEEVKRVNCQKGNEVVSIANLVSGVYIIQLVNGNGEKRNVQLLKE